MPHSRVPAYSYRIRDFAPTIGPGFGGMGNRIRTVFTWTCFHAATIPADRGKSITGLLFSTWWDLT